MDKPHITPKDFFLWAGAMVTFYWSVIAYIFLVFEYINYTFPNALTYYPTNPYESGISYQMASIIVLFPVYLLLVRLIKNDIARDPSRQEIWVRRWALILTLFVAGAAIVVDLITLLTTFLNGEALTTAFLLKVLVIFLVAGAVFLHFIADLRGYWSTHPARRTSVAIGVAVLGLATIIAGFFIVGTPAEARLARFDAQKVSDLQNIQSQVTYYWQAKQKLPENLDELNNPLSGGATLVDSEGNPYSYQKTGPLSFKLCADFNSQSRSNVLTERLTPTMPVGVKTGIVDDWYHDAGQVCFDRTIDPAFYPPLSKVQP